MRKKFIPMKNFSKIEIDKFYSRIIKGKLPNDCWGWIGASAAGGYSIFKNKYERYRANRVSIFLSTGVDPKELDVCHTCDNPICCNPMHLFIGTRSDNMRDASLKNRMKQGEDNVKSKLRKEDIPKIIEIYSKGNISQFKLGEKYSVSQTTIGRTIRRVYWKHVKVY